MEHVSADDTEARENIARIRSAVRQMAELIDGLLKLSRSTRGAIVRDAIDLGALAEDAVDSLRSAEPQREVSVTIAPDLQTTGTPALMRAVVDNLVGNAWKFTSRVQDARIEVGAAEREGERMFFVRDNGAGFDASRSRELFRPFGRLHSDKEFAGHGIGLATVQRILRRHGGRIEAESEEGAGSCFYFTTGDASRAAPAADEAGSMA